MTYALTNPTSNEVDPRKWEVEVRSAFFPLEFSVDQGCPLVADVRLNQFSGYKIIDVQADAHAAAMSIESCKRLTQRFVKVIWQQRGDAYMEQDGREVHIPAGHWTVYEASKSYKLRQSMGSSFVAFLCEAANHESMITLAQRTSGRCLRTEGGSAVALAALSMACAEGDTLAPRSRAAVLDFVASLLSEDVKSADGGSCAARRRSQEVLLGEAQQYVRHHFDQHDLSPDHIASALHVSRRTLYQAFELAGMTPQALVQQIRMERCCEVLSHLGSQDVSITQLALEFGFSDPAYFTRVFRKRFGQTPSQYRLSAQSQQSPSR